MSKVLLAGVVAALALVPASAHADPLPAACVVVTPAHVQAGYAPNGPSDCVVLA
ncbi:MAG TPA: hypothetical protein VNQ77_07390 [Frankiaceae bacterium]|nr:hypothetical protein [Frankiaceae bacterium]